MGLQKKKAAKLFDDGRPGEEQLPRRLRLYMAETVLPGRHGFVMAMFVQLIDLTWLQLGSTLSDNARRPDGYRGHDIIHLALMAVLGWSPTLRALLHRKRKSEPIVDEVEDGARASDIEETVVALIFAYAVKANYFRNTRTIPRQLWTQIQMMVAGREVAVHDFNAWNRAILSGFAVFRMLLKHRRGFVTADLETQSISFETMLVE